MFYVIDQEDHITLAIFYSGAAPKCIKRFRFGDWHEVRVNLKHVENVAMIDVRLFIASEEDPAKDVPTRTGLMFPALYATQIAKAVLEAVARQDEAPGKKLKPVAKRK